MCLTGHKWSNAFWLDGHIKVSCLSTCYDSHLIVCHRGSTWLRSKQHSCDESKAVIFTSCNKHLCIDHSHFTAVTAAALQLMCWLLMYQFQCRAGAEATAKTLTLPAQLVQRSPSPAPTFAPATAPTGSAPKDATERRSIPSGTSFIPGQLSASHTINSPCLLTF